MKGSEAARKADTSPDITKEKAVETFKKEDLGERETDYEGLNGYKPVGGLRARHLLDRDLRDDRRRKEGRPGYSRKRRYFGENELRSGAWLNVVDNRFALKLSETIDEWNTVQQRPNTANLCKDCKIYAALCHRPKTSRSSETEQLTINLIDLRSSKKSCDLCRLFLRCLTRYELKEEETVTVFRDGSVLKRRENSEPFLSILVDPGVLLSLISGLLV